MPSRAVLRARLGDLAAQYPSGIRFAGKKRWGVAHPEVKGGTYFEAQEIDP
jgi:hypothetical protein